MLGWPSRYSILRSFANPRIRSSLVHFRKSRGNPAPDSFAGSDAGCFGRMCEGRARPSCGGSRIHNERIKVPGNSPWGLVPAYKAVRTTAKILWARSHIGLI